MSSATSALFLKAYVCVHSYTHGARVGEFFLYQQLGSIDVPLERPVLIKDLSLGLEY